MRKSVRMSLVLCFAPILGASARGADGRLTLQPPASAVEAPIRLALPGDLFAPGRYLLSPEDGSPALPAVVLAGGGNETWSSLVFLNPGLSKPTTFTVKKVDDQAQGDGGVTFVPQGDNLQILVDGKEFAVHRVDAGPKPFLFPLNGPTGDRLTRAFPMEDVEGEDKDHPHQRSFWFTHGEVNGVDFWSELKNHGAIRETARNVVASGPVLGRLETRDDWLGPDGVKICEDERALTVYNTRSVRVLDFAVTIKASEGPLVFGDTKEGTFGVRVASSMDVDRKTGGKIRNADGLEDAAAWGKPSAWVDYTGPVNGKTQGIAILDDPTSFRHPTPWHVRTYGLFAANPFAYHDFGMGEGGEHKLRKGESIHFAYRLVLHVGDTQAAGIADQFRAYATPLDYELNRAE